MSEQLLNILKLFLLALLYLFFFRVLRAVWAEIASTGATVRQARTGRPNPSAPARASARSPGAGSSKRRRRSPSELTVIEPIETRGRRFSLADELTVGRAAGCSVTIDDTYVSQLHARVFRRDGQLYVEDLGSTNGTYLNRTKVSGPMLMRRGDRLQVGNTVLEVQ